MNAQKGRHEESFHFYAVTVVTMDNNVYGDDFLLEDPEHTISCDIRKSTRNKAQKWFSSAQEDGSLFYKLTHQIKSCNFCQNT